MIGFLTYLPTVAYIPHILYALILPYLLIKKQSSLKLGSKKDLLLVLAIVVFSIANTFFHAEKFVELKDYLPFTVLIIITYLAALNMTAKDAKILVYLIALECVVVVLESVMGVSTFFTGLKNYSAFEANSLLYFNRPLGLSTNSSVIALKIFAAILLIHFYKLKSTYLQIAKALLFIGLVLTFNRTVLVTLFFFYGLYFLQQMASLQVNKVKFVLYVLGLSFFSFALLFYADFILATVLNQFTRSTGKIELTGREFIWLEYWEFIKQHFLFGNGSFKYLLDTFVRGKVYHAHNSFLQVLATHGFFIFMIYMVLIAKNITKKNYLYIITIMLYSTSQYGIFWGVSLLDIVFFAFLLGRSEAFNYETEQI